MTPRSLLILIVLTGQCISCLCQEEPPSLNTIPRFPEKFFNNVSEKSSKLESMLDRRTEKYLQRFLRKEQKIKKQLQRMDSATAAELFSNVDSLYAFSVKSSPGRAQYLPHLDTLKTSLRFLEENSELLSTLKRNKERIEGSLQQVKSLQSKLQDAEQVQAFIRQRRDAIKNMLKKYSRLPRNLTKVYQDFNKDIYYYSQQVQEYKEILNDPDKLTRKALDLLSRTSLFQKFMSQHSELATLFPMPANYGTPQAITGLQTRSQVMQMVQAQLAGGGPGAQQVLQSNLQAAQQQLYALKDKVSKLGSSINDPDMDMPDFKPNKQKTKNFLQRLELGTNLQSTKSNTFLPTTTDFGLSVGYKLSDKSVIGIGGSYKVGWGKDIRNIVITSEGAGVRSFLDIVIKGSFYVSGGYEYNYQPMSTPGTRVDAWSQSGLIGLSKIVSIKTKIFRKTKIQLYWDFLSYGQEPRTQALKFRVGYNF